MFDGDWRAIITWVVICERSAASSHECGQASPYRTATPGVVGTTAAGSDGVNAAHAASVLGSNRQTTSPPYGSQPSRRSASKMSPVNGSSTPPMTRSPPVTSGVSPEVSASTTSAAWADCRSVGPVLTSDQATVPLLAPVRQPATHDVLWGAPPSVPPTQTDSMRGWSGGAA